MNLKIENFLIDLKQDKNLDQFAQILVQARDELPQEENKGTGQDGKNTSDNKGSTPDKKQPPEIKKIEEMPKMGIATAGDIHGTDAPEDENESNDKCSKIKNQISRLNREMRRQEDTIKTPLAHLIGANAAAQFMNFLGTVIGEYKTPQPSSGDEDAKMQKCVTAGFSKGDMEAAKTEFEQCMAGKPLSKEFWDRFWENKGSWAITGNATFTVIYFGAISKLIWNKLHKSALERRLGELVSSGKCDDPDNRGEPPEYATKPRRSRIKKRRGMPIRHKIIDVLPDIIPQLVPIPSTAFPGIASSYSVSSPPSSWYSSMSDSLPSSETALKAGGAVAGTAVVMGLMALSEGTINPANVSVVLSPAMANISIEPLPDRMTVKYVDNSGVMPRIVTAKVRTSGALASAVFSNQKGASQERPGIPVYESIDDADKPTGQLFIISNFDDKVLTYDELTLTQDSGSVNKGNSITPINLDNGYDKTKAEQICTRLKPTHVIS